MFLGRPERGRAWDGTTENGSHKNKKVYGTPCSWWLELGPQKRRSDDRLLGIRAKGEKIKAAANSVRATWPAAGKGVVSSTTTW